jgi:VWFA-related protein
MTRAPKGTEVEIQRPRFDLRPLFWLAALAVLLAPSLSAQQRTTFRSGTTLVSVDVVVRDRQGTLVRGLTADDFEVREDGQPQKVLTFSFQEIDDKAAATPGSVELLGDIQARVKEAALQPPSAIAKPVAVDPDAPPTPLRSEDVAGKRLIVLLFDVSSMEPEDVQRSIDSAQKYVKEQMSPADMIAVATVSSMLNVLTDFTSDRTKVEAALNTLAWTEGTATPPPDAATMATDEVTAATDPDTAAAEETAELDLFNNDMRLRILKTLAETLTPIEQKKAIIYFSAGMGRSGSDNQVELRAAINAAVRGNVAIYAVDTRGLQAVVPGGDARQASGRGQALFSGRGVAQQFARLSSSQSSLTSLAADTGGRVFTDTNNFGAAFNRLRRDMSAYYLLGYASGNSARDGRFRRIAVRPKNPELRIEARAGYYAERDFANTARGDRETQMTDQLYAAVSATDLPVIVTANYFRLSDAKYYVPVSLTVPGSFVPVPPGKDKAQVDILGEVRDERGFPVGRIRQTMELPAAASATLAGKQVLYQTGMTLPPGRFSIKVVVRENAGGTMGTFEAPITVPELAKAPVKVSSVVLSTQLQPFRNKSDNPLVRDGVQLVPNLTHVVGRDQKLYFYYEVYDPALAAGSGPALRTSLAFYRGKVKVLETPIVSRSAVDDAGRKAALFRFEIDANQFERGLYTCQVNIIDDVAGTFTFPRLDLYVR